MVAAAVEVRDRRRRNRNGGQLAAQAERVEFTHCVGERIDSHAERPQRLRPLDDGGSHTALLEGQCGGEPADACSRDLPR